MDFLHRYYSNPGEQGCSPALEPEETQQWQLTEEGLYSSPNIICVKKSRYFRWVGHMAYNDTEETYILSFTGEA
jgi:hypothetical protein